MMCFMAGANAVFTGEQMLTTPCELFPLVCLDGTRLTRLARLSLGRGMSKYMREWTVLIRTYRTKQ